MSELTHESEHQPNKWGNSDGLEEIDAREFVEAVFNADETCSWCATPLFETTETPGGTRRDPAPEADRAYFSPTTVDGHRKPGGKRTYCVECGRTDPPAPHENRTHRERHEHLDHVLEHVPPCHSRAVEPPCHSDEDVPPSTTLDTDAAHAVVSRLNRRDDVADLDALAAAVDAAFPDE